MSANLSDQEIAELEQNGEWEQPVTKPPVKSPRAVVSVAFSRSELEQVAEAARASQMKTSEFIRSSALKCAVPQTRFSTVVSGVVSTAYGAFRGPETTIRVTSSVWSTLTATT